MPLRYYQEDAKQATLFALEEYDSAILSTATASGKTVMGSHIIGECLPKRCLWLADSDELCEQPLTVISREIGVIPALHKASKKASLLAKVVVGSSQTLQRQKHLEYYPTDHFQYVLIDEVHRGLKRDQKICEHFSRAKRIGLTATPFTSSLRDLSKYFETVAYHMPMLDLIKEGFAPPLKVLTLPVEIDLANVETKRGFEGKDYDSESLSTTIAPYYEKIAELIAEHAAKRHTIVFLPLIKSSQAFAEICRSHGISAVHIDGKDPERADKIRAFNAGRIMMLTNADLLGTGWDSPICDCIVNLTPTRSMVRYQQRIGRGLRVLPGVVDGMPEKERAEERQAAIAASGKPDLLLLDFLFLHDELGVIRPGHLVSNSVEDANAIYEKVKDQKTPEDLQRIAKLVQEEREALVVKRLEEVATRTSTRTIEPAAFGYLIGSQSIMQYEPVARWEMEPPSQAQLEKLGKWGIDVSGVTSKGLASKLMSALIHRFRYKLATVNQLRALAKLYVTFDPHRLTLKEASRLIAERKLAAIR